MKSAYRFVFLLCGAFALGVVAGKGVNLRGSIAQGYEGLISGGKSNQGYKGLIPGTIAPEAPETAQQQPSGPVNPSSPSGPQNKAPMSVAEGQKYAPFSVQPGYVPPRPITSVDDIQMVAMERPLKIDWETTTLPPEMVQTLNGLLKPEDKENLAKPRFRMGGMLPDEFFIKQKIDRMMSAVDNTSLPMDVRKANARKAMEKLRGQAHYLQNRKEIPDAIFINMGVPETYMREERESVEGALKRVHEAMKMLKNYEE